MEGNPIRAPHLELLIELLGEPESGWCVDLGCGSGVVAERILDRWPVLRVFGVDGSPPMLEMARERLARFGDRVSLHQADLAAASGLAGLAPPLATAAIAIQALHHLPRAELGAVLEWTRERLQPGGLLAIIDPVLIPSERLYGAFRKAKEHAGWRWNPDTFAGYRGGLAEGHDRLLPVDEYLEVIRGAGFEAACLDLRADRALLIGRS